LYLHRITACCFKEGQSPHETLRAPAAIEQRLFFWFLSLDEQRKEQTLRVLNTAIYHEVKVIVTPIHRYYMNSYTFFFIRIPAFRCIAAGMSGLFHDTGTIFNSLSGHVPVISSHVPVISGHVPVISGHLPVISGHFRSSSSHFWSSSGHFRFLSGSYLALSWLLAGSYPVIKK